MVRAANRSSPRSSTRAIDLLDSESFDVWWDTEIYVGRSFADLIEQAIDDCRHVIVLWSLRLAKPHGQNADAECFSGFEIDKELELCRLLYREFTRLGTL
jgi:hypothetical protein